MTPLLSLIERDDTDAFCFCYHGLYAGVTFYHSRDLFNLRVDVVLYDLTTLRFESTKNEEDTLRRFGYSKEMRTDCTQVILGLLVDPEGIPLGFEVYPGNTFEGKTRYL